MMVSVHERGYLPNFKYEGFTIAQSMATDVAISRTKYTKLGKPYSDCREDPNNLLSKDSEYHYKTRNISLYSQNIW